MNTEPVLTVASITAAVIALVAILGYNVDPSAVEAIIYVVVAAVGAFIARSKVTPVKKA